MGGWVGCIVSKRFLDFYIFFYLQGPLAPSFVVTASEHEHLLVVFEILIPIISAHACLHC